MTTYAKGQWLQRRTDPLELVEVTDVYRDGAVQVRTLANKQVTTTAHYLDFQFEAVST